MSSQNFAAISQRCKNSISPTAMSDRVLALVLGWSPENFAIAKANGCFPVKDLKDVARSFPSLELDVDWILQDGANPDECPPAFLPAFKEIGLFEPPSSEEMAAYMDAEMQRLGVGPFAPGAAA